MPARACVRWLLAALLLAPLPAQAQEDATLGLQLNKLAAREGACRVYLVLDNATAHSFTDLRLDLVLFGSDGAIANRLGVDVAPLAAGKTFAKVFDIQGMACSDLQRVLLNGTLACAARGSAEPDCTALAEPSSRLATPFIK